MTRKEQVEAAGKEHASRICGTFSITDIPLIFEAGVEWAEKHPGPLRAPLHIHDRCQEMIAISEELIAESKSFFEKLYGELQKRGLKNSPEFNRADKWLLKAKWLNMIKEGKTVR